jgi:hypothetical protein
LVIIPTDASTPYSGSLQQALSTPGAKWAELGAVGGNKDVVTLKATYSILKCLALSNTVDTGPEIAF